MTTITMTFYTAKDKARKALSIWRSTKPSPRRASRRVSPSVSAAWFAAFPSALIARLYGVQNSRFTSHEQTFTVSEGPPSRFA